MNLSADTLDDLLFDIFSQLTGLPFNILTTRGNTSEVIGGMLRLDNPRARLSRTETKGTVFSALGELLWYLSKSNELDFIKYYISRYQDESEDGATIYGAYGPRLFSAQGECDQIQNVIKTLQERPTSRRAVIQLFEARDISEDHLEIPCTCTLQFVIRDNQLNMITYMRSNDAFLGLPHDVFAFTMIQEILARSLDVEMGLYYHAVGSLHLYENMKDPAQAYMKEGLQSTKKNMPEMPEGDPWPSLKILLDAESKIRNNETVDIDSLELHPYWQDLIRIIKIHSLFKVKDYLSIESLKKQMSNNVYNTFIEKRLLISQQKNSHQ